MLIILKTSENSRESSAQPVPVSGLKYISPHLFISNSQFIFESLQPGGNMWGKEIKVLLKTPLPKNSAVLKKGGNRIIMKSTVVFLRLQAFWGQELQLHVYLYST